MDTAREDSLAAGSGTMEVYTPKTDQRDPQDSCRAVARATTGLKLGGTRSSCNTKSPASERRTDSSAYISRENDPDQGSEA